MQALKASTALETLFTRQFGPRRAEALASEITRIAKRLGPQRFKDALHAIDDQHGLPNPTEAEKAMLEEVCRNLRATAYPKARWFDE